MTSRASHFGVDRLFSLTFHSTGWSIASFNSCLTDCSCRYSKSLIKYCRPVLPSCSWCEESCSWTCFQMRTFTNYQESEYSGVRPIVFFITHRISGKSKFSSYRHCCLAKKLEAKQYFVCKVGDYLHRIITGWTVVQALC